MNKVFRRFLDFQRTGFQDPGKFITKTNKTKIYFFYKPK
jgi:hypothetical protein